MDLGQPLDLMSMILTPLQPGPPPAAAAGFEDTLAALLSGESVPDLHSDSYAPGPQEPAMLAPQPLPLGPIPSLLRAEEAPLLAPTVGGPQVPSETPAPGLEAPRAPDSEAPDPALTAGALVHQALRLPSSALLAAASPGTHAPLQPVPPPTLSPQTGQRSPAVGPAQIPEAPVTASAPIEAPAQVARPAETSPPSPPPALPQGLGVRVLQQGAGRREHPLLQLEKAAGARWTQLAQQTVPTAAPAGTPTEALDWAPVLPQTLGPERKETPGGPKSDPALPQSAGFAEMPTQEEPAQARTQTSTALPVPQSAETPEEWVPTPRFLEVEIDPELSLSLSASGRELDLSLSGSSEALAPLGEMEGELREGLERSGWQLRDFTTQERGRGQRERQPPRETTQDGPKASPQGPKARGPLPRGEHINRVA